MRLFKVVIHREARPGAPTPSTVSQIGSESLPLTVLCNTYDEAEKAALQWMSENETNYLLYKSIHYIKVETPHITVE